MDIFDNKNALSGEDIFLALSSFHSGFKIKLSYINDLKVQPAGEKNILILVNTAHSGQLGEHWFLVIVTPKNIISFDSYGRDLDIILAPEGMDVPLWLKDCINGCPQRIQNVDSVVCGYYVIDYFFLFEEEKQDVEETFNLLKAIYKLQTHNLAATVHYDEEKSKLNDEFVVHRVRQECPYFKMSPN